MDSTGLEENLSRTIEEIGIDEEQQEAVGRYLLLLKDKHLPTYEHSLRVAEKAKDIADFLGENKKSAWFAGALHDVGKILIDKGLLEKKGRFDERERERMKEHPLYGYMMIKDRFLFTAEIVLRHHRFQKDRYPEVLPEPPFNYSERTTYLIEQNARILALADFYDALTNRDNGKFMEGKIASEEARLIMTENNSDKKELIENLYEKKIFE